MQPLRQIGRVHPSNHSLSHHTCTLLTQQRRSQVQAVVHQLIHGGGIATSGCYFTQLLPQLAHAFNNTVVGTVNS